MPVWSEPRTADRQEAATLLVADLAANPPGTALQRVLHAWPCRRDDMAKPEEVFIYIGTYSSEVAARGASEVS